MKEETYWVDVVYIDEHRERVCESIVGSELNAMLNKYDDSQIYARIFFGRN